MLRRPKIREYEEKEFDEELFKREVEWLKRIRDGKTISCRSSAEIAPAFFTATLVGFLVGATIGAFLSSFTHNLLWFILLPTTLFAITFYFSLKPYSIMHIDRERNKMQYQGGIMFAGQLNEVNYRGPVDIIDGTQAIRHHRSKRIYIRFLTNSGYMRIDYNLVRDEEFLKRLEELGLINLQELYHNIQRNEVISRSNQWKIIYQEKFDRSEFKERRRKEKEERERRRIEELEEKKKRLIEKSKKRKSN